MKLDLCLPTILYLVVAVGSLLLALATPVQSMGTILPRAVMMGTMAVLLEVLCRYGYKRVAWVILALMFVLPMVLMFPLFMVIFFLTALAINQF
jgi:hypothetical protein